MTEVTADVGNSRVLVLEYLMDRLDEVITVDLESYIKEAGLDPYPLCINITAEDPYEEHSHNKLGEEVLKEVDNTRSYKITVGPLLKDEDLRE